MKKIALLSLFSFLFFPFGHAQEEEFQSRLTDYMEDLMEEESSKIDFEEVMSEMESRMSNKINLNTADKTQLSELPYLTEFDIQNIIRHRQSFGNFQTLYELKNIPNFDQEKIFRILPLITIEQEQQKKNWRQEIERGKHFIYNQYQQVIQQKKGYLPDSLGKSKYTGIPSRYYLKYQFRTVEKVSFGWLGERDAGEPFGVRRDEVFDFKSAHLQIENVWRFKRINIGDYKANFGQGLVIGTSCLFGKSSNTLNTFQQQEGLKKYTSSNECGFLRGAGATLVTRNLEVSLFFSHKKTDANLNDTYITSLKTDGLHRTVSEISKRKNVTESIIGWNTTFTKKSLQIGCTFLAYRYSDTLAPTDKMYNHFKLRETDRHFNLGVNYKYYFRRMSIFGESAIDANGGCASLNAISIIPNSRIGILVLQRWYQPKYQANYSNAFGENSKTENEEGWYLGAKLLPVKKIEFSIYSDVFVFPWAKYNINYTSKGEEFMVHLQYNTNKRMNMQLKYKYKDYIDQGYNKQNIRYINHLRIKQIETQTLIEGNRAKSVSKESFGWVMSEDVQIRKRNIGLNFHYAYFDASEYNNRFYLYERDILNAFSMPQLYGKGHRIDINFKWDFNTHVQLNINYGMYIYTDGRTTIGSSNEQIEGNKSSMIKGLLRWRFQNHPHEAIQASESAL